MVVGELRHGQITIIDRLREPVRLAEGLRKSPDLGIDARQRAMQCLSRFGERLHDMKAASVRAAGTSALRGASNSRSFIEKAEQVLGHPIAVISGIEEARLIYKGVTHSMPATDGPRLVLDIGGGSTELILGTGPIPQMLDSLKMGCVATTERYFADDEISATAFGRARIAARLQLRPVKAHYRSSEKFEAIGTSGTIRATQAVARALGLIESQTLTRQAVESLIERVLQFNRLTDLSMPGLSAARAAVWPGGLAILVELFTALRVDNMSISSGALREGLLYDSLGRLQHKDARERSVVALAQRFQVDIEQADRVSKTAHALLEQCAIRWDIDSPLAAELLAWAARLHEIGLDIAHSGFHKHGAYVVENADMPGFPRDEQQMLAFMLRNQRSSPDPDYCEELPDTWRRSALRLTVLLRLAVLLNRSRSRQELPYFSLETQANSIRLSFPEDWLRNNPLSVADLQRELKYLSTTGMMLEFNQLTG